MEECMKYAVQMGSGTMTYIPSVIKTCSGIQNLYGGIHRQAMGHTDSKVIKQAYFHLFKPFCRGDYIAIICTGYIPALPTAIHERFRLYCD
jgi:hypothetical protein